MSTLLPESLARLTATSFVTDAELVRVGRVAIIRQAAEQMAEGALRKLLKDCITTKDYQGHMGQTLYLDAYVLSPAELHRLIAGAREQGAKDALRWTAP